MSNQGFPERESSLPFDPLKELALLGHMLKIERLRIQGMRKIEIPWFVSRDAAEIWALMKKEWERHDKKITPNKPALIGCPAWLALNESDKNRYIKTIAKAEQAAEQIKWEFVEKDLTTWMQSKVLEKAIRQSASMWNGGKWHETASIMRKAVTEMKDTSFDEGIEISFEKPQEWLHQAKTEKTHALTTGLTVLDHCLLPGRLAPHEVLATKENIGGGLQRGDTTIVMASSNTGKTTCMLTMAIDNIRAGKHVLLITHEGRPEDIRMKLLKCFLGKTERKILNAFDTEEDLRAMNIATNKFREFLTYIPYNKAGMKVEAVTDIIRKSQEDRIAAGRPGYDLLVVDYPAKLTTDQTSSSLALRNVLEIVYEYFVQLALEYKFHSLLAIQTNREGSKVNNGMNSNRLLTMEDVSEAWGPMTSATNVITLNRTPNAKRQKRLTFYVAKSRSSTTGYAVVAKTDYAHGRTHGDNLGAVCYQSELSYDTVCGSWLEDPNKQHRLLDEQGRPIAWPDEEPAEASK